MLRQLYPLLGVLLLAAPSDASDWPQWHGPLRDRHSPDPVAARLTTLPADLAPLWRLAIGPGHASPIVHGPHLVYLDDNGTQTVAHALNPETGQELWRTPFGTSFADEWGAGPRCTPLLDGERVYVQSPEGEFRCLSLRDGSVLWGKSYTRDYGAPFTGAGPGDGAASRRGYNGSAVIHGDTVVLPVGSPQATLIACDKVTGNERWRAGTDELAYASLVVANLAGIPQVIAFTAEALTGARLTDGRILWRMPFRTAAQRHVATPLVAGNLVIVNSHTFGMAAVRVLPAPEGCHAEEAWRNPALKINLSTAVQVGDHLYTLGADKDFVSIEVASGKVAWSVPDFVGPGRRDYAAVLAAGDRLLALNDTGLLRLLQADPTRYVELAQAQVCGNTWSFPALAQGRLYVRDGRQLLCFPLHPPDPP